MEGAVAQDAGVVDEDVHLAVGIYRRLDDRLAARHRIYAVVVGHCLPSGGADLICYLVGHGGAGAGAVTGAAQVVHHHLGAAGG